jgi:hypothetical protein
MRRDRSVFFDRWRRAGEHGSKTSRSSEYRHRKPLKPPAKVYPKRLRQRLKRFTQVVVGHSGRECPPKARLSASAKRCHSTRAGHQLGQRRAVYWAAKAGSQTTRNPSNQSVPWSNSLMRLDSGAGPVEVTGADTIQTFLSAADPVR